jgi:hypothetical protein
MSSKLKFLLSKLLLVSSLLAAPLRVDINQETQRKDVLTQGWENWMLKEGASASRKFAEVTVTVRTAGPVGKGLATSIYKAALDTAATVAADGVFVKEGNKGGSLELVLSGLSPDRHTLTTFHNSLWKEPMSAFSVRRDGAVLRSGLHPSERVSEDADLAGVHISFEAGAGKDVVFTYTPDGSGAVDNIILNGFELDRPDPAALASRPFPFDGDEHAPEAAPLSWRASKSATTHQIYVGSSAEAVAKATPASPEFKGGTVVTQYVTQEASPLALTYWRVDEVAADKTVTQGPVWRFRTRHLAFPGAEGYGRFAIGGRGGRVLEVTQLGDSGPGSLREAVDAEGPRTVVFRVGGAIKLKSKLVIKNPYITVAGQTAPGDGIAVHGFTFAPYGTHDVILRYLRIRVGDESGVTMDGSGLGGCNHAIMDHCSVAWSIDEGFSSRGAKNITLQRSIVGEALNMSIHSHYVGTGKGHGFAGSISGDIGSFHHNLVANCAGRNWSLAGGLNQAGRFAGRLDIRNNVVYNWEHRTNDGGVKALNLVSNYYIPGPASRVFHLLMPDFGSKTDPQQYFMQGNRMEGRPQYDADNWAAGGARLQPQEMKKTGLDATEALSLIRLGAPFCEAFVATQPAAQAYEMVMADVGANFPRYDSVDARLVGDVLGRTTTAKGSKTGLPGIIDSQKDVGGYPIMKGGEAPADSDHDGLPDAWELAHGLDPRDPSDGAKTPQGKDSYTNLELYLNALPKL